MQIIIGVILCVFSYVHADLYSNSDAVRKCRCVAQEMCKDNYVAISEGEGLFDVRIDSRGYCDNANEVCCEYVASALQPPIDSNCGIQTWPAHTTRIRSSSHSAQFGEVPWTVLVLEKNFILNKYVQRCGGSLINPQVVMTVAHCVNDPEITHWTIRAGDWNIRSRDEPLPHQDRTVQDVLVHPFYKASTVHYDVALLTLTKPFDLADNVKLICLPPVSMQFEQVKCLVSGWGKENLENGEYSTALKVIELPLVKHEECQRALRNTRLGKFFKLHKSFLCAGGEQNKDACKGDGGSPLVCPVPGQPGRYVQLGIVSWGIGCGENNTPGVYVNVSHIRNWVDDQLTLLNFEIRTYRYD